MPSGKEQSNWHLGCWTHGIVTLIGVGYGLWDGEKFDAPESRPAQSRLPDDELEFHRVAARQVIELGGSVTIRHLAMPLRGLNQLQKIDGPIVSVILRGQPVRDAELADVAAISSLLYLNLTLTDITDGALPQFRNLAELRELRLNSTAITDAGLESLPDLPSLELLELRSTRITDAGLANIRRFPKLQTVVLTDTAITDDGVPHLLHSPALRYLRLNDTQISDASVPSLASLKGLEALGVRNTRISADGLQQLRAKLPRTDVIPPRETNGREQ